MITTFEQLLEAYQLFIIHNDGFPASLVDVSVLPDTYALTYSGEEFVQSDEFYLPISHEDFEIKLAEFWDEIIEAWLLEEE